ncbi:hypothetical protein [Streptomyces erythrochromogenes]|uniref:hypothetical protein n=1 Tax=Streptomyces erythrochromogenes TaxID=285574 RepID=UPI0036CE624B
MPKKAPGGSETVELLEYLFGPGERDEHTDPHLIVAWDPDLPCPARDPDRMTLTGLALLLDAPVEALRGPRPAEHVWHVSVRNHGDRTLSDAEWSEVAAAMVHAAATSRRPSPARTAATPASAGASPPCTPPPASSVI